MEITIILLIYVFVLVSGVVGMAILFVAAEFSGRREEAATVAA